MCPVANLQAARIRKNQALLVKVIKQFNAREEGSASRPPMVGLPAKVAFLLDPRYKLLAREHEQSPPPSGLNFHVVWSRVCRP